MSDAVRIFVIGFSGVFLTLAILVIFIEVMGRVIRLIERR